MPTVLLQAPQQARSGTQTTPYANLPNKFDFVQLTSQAADAVHSDTANAVRFEVLYSANGQGNDEKIIQVEEWSGGTFTPKGSATPVPRAMDITFGPVPANGSCALRAVFNRTMTIGVTLAGLP